MSEFQALESLAAAPASPELADTIKQAKASGVSFIAILLALASHAGDIKAIISAILELISKVKPEVTPN